MMFHKILNYIFLFFAALYGKMNYYLYMKKSKKADKINEKKILRFIKQNKKTEIGKKYHFDEINSIKEFQDNIPLTTYDDYQKYIEETATKRNSKLAC